MYVACFSCCRLISIAIPPYECDAETRPEMIVSVYGVPCLSGINNNWHVSILQPPPVLVAFQGYEACGALVLLLSLSQVDCSRRTSTDHSWIRRLWTVSERDRREKWTFGSLALVSKSYKDSMNHEIIDMFRAFTIDLQLSSCIHGSPRLSTEVYVTRATTN